MISVCQLSLDDFCVSVEHGLAKVLSMAESKCCVYGYVLFHPSMN